MTDAARAAPPGRSSRALAWAAAGVGVALALLAFDIVKDTTSAWLIGRDYTVRNLVASALWFGLWAPFVPVAFAVAGAARSRRVGWLAAGAVVVAGVVVIALAHLLVTAVALRAEAGDLSLRSVDLQFRHIYARFGLVDVYIGASLIAAKLAADHYRGLRERTEEAARLQIRAAELERTATEARLAALRAQLDPHFLFNALNAVSGLVRTGSREDAVTVVARVSALLRETLTHDDDQVRLGRELDLVGQYLDIERVRFGDRLTARVRAPDDVLDARVPVFVLQPLVENAMRHGVARVTGPVTVDIAARRCGDELVLSVTDSARGTGGKPVAEGVGLSNTRARLVALYGDRAELRLDDVAGGGVEARVRLPFERLSRAPEAGDA